MGNYNGPAHLILDNGSEIPVTADLRTSTSGSHADWDGVLSAAPEHRVVLANTDRGRLRMKDGREGAFACLDPSTWILTGQAHIMGSDGEVPF